MSVRINQEDLLLGVPQGSSAKVRINQEALLIALPSVTPANKNVRINQEALLVVVPTILILSGTFQDALGNPIANGTITFRLFGDSQAASNLVVGSRIIKVTLDSTGSIPAGISLTPNTSLTPSGSFYLATVYNQKGEICWRTSFVATSSAFNLGTVTPNL